jgi:hypothetical protein
MQEQEANLVLCPAFATISKLQTPTVSLATLDVRLLTSFGRICLKSV